MISWRDRESQNLPWCPRPFYWVWKASWSSYGLRSVVGSSSPVGCSRIEILFTHFDKKNRRLYGSFRRQYFGGAYWGCLTHGLLEFASHESPHGAQAMPCWLWNHSVRPATEEERVEVKLSWEFTPTTLHLVPSESQRRVWCTIEIVKTINAHTHRHQIDK